MTAERSAAIPASRLTILDVMRDSQLFGSVLTGVSWVSWMCCAAAIFGIADGLTPT